jgi:hypothetical protein
MGLRYPRRALREAAATAFGEEARLLVYEVVERLAGIVYVKTTRASGGRVGRTGNDRGYFRNCTSKALTVCALSGAPLNLAA